MNSELFLHDYIKQYKIICYTLNYLKLYILFKVVQNNIKLHEIEFLM